MSPTARAGRRYGQAGHDRGAPADGGPARATRRRRRWRFSHIPPPGIEPEHVACPPPGKPGLGPRGSAKTQFARAALDACFARGSQDPRLERPPTTGARGSHMYGVRVDRRHSALARIARRDSAPPSRWEASRGSRVSRVRRNRTGTRRDLTGSPLSAEPDAHGLPPIRFIRVPAEIPCLKSASASRSVSIGSGTSRSRTSILSWE